MEYDGRPVSDNVHYLNFKNRNQKIVSDNLISKGDYKSIDEELLKLKPSVPVHFIRPNSIKKSAQWFLKHFAGEVLYSVKSNPDQTVIKHLHSAGIKHFDVASLSEIKLINSLFGNDAKMYFMHPIKSREAIFESYFNFGIRDYSLDSFDELKKILEVTNNAKDLSLHIRLAIPNSHAAIDLSGKFGILPSESSALIRKTRTVAKNLGICFHVGSQCMEPSEYRGALMMVKEVLEQSKVKLDVLDIGGGFPSSYPGLTPPPLINYIDEINDTVKSLNLGPNCKLWCEPGRALVAEAGSLLVRVEGRKNNMLYLNDGTYGALFDAGYPGFIYTSRAIRIKNGKVLSNNMAPFGFYGPTCDSLDTMKGPFYLPENIIEGDYIEIGGLGAYSKSMRTGFNGFDSHLQIEVNDEPLISMYQDQSIEVLQKNQSL